ncbi:MAG: PilZ domain-containing protein [bacterium]
MSQKRALKRIQLRCRLDVYDAITEKGLGQVLDIHTAGLLLLSAEPLERNASFNLRLALPEEICGKRAITFEGTSVWAKEEAEMGFHTTGFSMQNMSEENKAVITALIEMYGISK